MNFYISQLDENKKIIPIIEKYNVGLEIVQFSNPFILDNKEQFIKEYKKTNIKIISKGMRKILIPFLYNIY